MDDNKKSWDSNLPLAVWDDSVTINKAIGDVPFDSVYGIQARLSQNNLMSLYKFVQKYDDDIVDDMQERMNELVGLNEHRRDASTKSARL